MKNFFTLIIGLLFLPTLVLAQDSSQFLVSVVGGEDTTPPSTPTLLDVVPTASTQIDVSWSAVTDDVVVSGYVLFRNGVTVATTTLTSYSDTGLAPETLYDYEVYAFDGFYNISSTSNQLSTTTLALPVTPVATSSTNNTNSTIVFKLLGFQVEVGTSEAKLTWRTSLPARYELRWGRGDAYDLGYIINDTYRGEHNTAITQLEPGTTYQYELVGYNARGQMLLLKKGDFKTLSLVGGIPSNVLGFTGRAVGDDAILTWERPNDMVGEVRVVRSHLGYPNDPYDGAVVYVGDGNEAFDQGVLGRFEEVFYTAFVVWPDGTVSSGAVTKVKRSTGAGVNQGGEDDQVVIVDEPEMVAPAAWEFSRTDIKLIQADRVDTFATGTKPRLKAGESFLVRIPFEAVPKNLKSIIVTVSDPALVGRTYSYLLRINKEGNAYEAVVPALRVSGDSELMLEIYDFERMVVGRYKKQVEFFMDKEAVPEAVFPDKLVLGLKPYMPYVVAGLVVLSVTLVWWRRRDEDKD